MATISIRVDQIMVTQNILLVSPRHFCYYSTSEKVLLLSGSSKIRPVFVSSSCSNLGLSADS